MNADSSDANIYGYTAMAGMAGAYLASGFAVMQALVPVEDIPNAVGFQAIGAYYYYLPWAHTS